MLLAQVVPLRAAESLSGVAASWIWSSEDGPGDTWMCFTHQVTLDSVPVTVPATIAADSTYWLWINGVPVIEAGGLKRGPTPTGTYADHVDLAGYLKPGRNRIAALVWYYGISSSSHLDSGKGGFLLDASSAGLRTSSQWLVRVHPGYASRPANAAEWRPLRFNMSSRTGPPPAGSVDVLAESPIQFDARADLPGWQVSDPGEGWSAAVEKGVPPAAPWGELVSRPIPFFRVSEPLKYENNEDLKMPLSGPVTLTGRLPANLQVLPRLRVNAKAGQEIVIKVERARRDAKYITREGEQEFEVSAWGNGESVSYRIPADVQVLDIGYRETGFDTDLRGSFTCNDPRLNILWKKCVRSVYLNMREFHMDGPDRERSPWPADMADAGTLPYYLFDRRADTLQVKMFREFLAWQAPNGVLWGAVPSGRFKGAYREFPCQNLQVIAIAMPHHVEQTGDLKIAAEMVLPVRRYLVECWKMDADGLPVPRPANTEWGAGTAKWMDHTEGVDRRLFETVWYAWALMGVDYLRETGGLYEDKEIKSRRQSIAASFDRVFWDEGVNAYRSPGFKEPPDERGNAIAICAGLAPAHRRDALISVLQTTEKSSIYTERFPVEALFLLGEPNMAMERLLRRYAAEIKHPYSTLPEHFGYGNDPVSHGWNHAYGAVPAAILVRRVAGIRPVTPGYGRFIVHPQPAGLSEFDVRVSSVRGDISVKWREIAGRATLTVVCPPAASAVVDFPATQSWAEISAQGMAADEQNQVCFSVGPGTWTFEGVAK